MRYLYPDAGISAGSSACSARSWALAVGCLYCQSVTEAEAMLPQASL